MDIRDTAWFGRGKLLFQAKGRDAMPKEKAMPLFLRAWWVLLVPRVLFKCY